MKNAISFILATFLIVSCQTPSEFEGYKKSNKGFYYQLKSLGESNREIETGDYVTADVVYSTMKDSVFFKGRRKIKLEAPAYKGAIEDCFTTIREGENATFIIQSEPFFVKTLETNLPGFLQSSEYFKVDINIIEVQKESDYEKEKEAFLHWTEDFGDYEKVVLQQYVAEEKIDVEPTASGLIYIPVEAGSGPQIEKNDTITIHYEGIFLNGKYFDSTKRRKQPFQFVYGTEWQVIKGLEEGLGFMHEGEKALFIVPSNLAFGTTGSSTGIVPPFTSLIFKVEVLSVKKGIIE